MRDDGASSPTREIGASPLTRDELTRTTGAIPLMREDGARSPTREIGASPLAQVAMLDRGRRRGLLSRKATRRPL